MKFIYKKFKVVLEFDFDKFSLLEKNGINKEIIPNQGHCIRCHYSIPFNLEKPLCYKCYRSWAQYENIDYPENHCLWCGENHRTTYIKPLCYKCWQIYDKYSLDEAMNTF